jgi:hypothetical protein
MRSKQRRSEGVTRCPKGVFVWPYFGFSLGKTGQSKQRGALAVGFSKTNTRNTRCERSTWKRVSRGFATQSRSGTLDCPYCFAYLQKTATDPSLIRVSVSFFDCLHVLLTESELDLRISAVFCTCTSTSSSKTCVCLIC